MIDRRTVLKGAAAACGACALAACGGDEPAVSAPPDPAVEGSLASFDDIPVGSAVSARTADDEAIVIVRTSETEASAFSAVCPHQGCNVEPDGERFSCPCHGSRFTLDGEVERGPAAQPLSAFAVRVEGGQVLPA